MLQQLVAAGSRTLRAACAATLVWNNAYAVGHGQGESMLPTFNSFGDFTHENKLCRYARNCDVGDVVMFRKPTDPQKLAIKRITGMPGDIVVVDPTRAGSPSVEIPEGHVWVTGDNIPASADSRHFGPVPMGLIGSKVFAVSSSWNEFQWVENTLQPIYSPVEK